MSATPTPTPDASGNDVFLGGDQPGTDNVVSVVAVLCGTDACMSNTWNNVRFVDQTTSTDNTDLGPLYRPDSTNDDSFSDKKAADMENTENQEDNEHTNIIPIAIAVPLAAAVLAVVGFVLYWRKRKKRNPSSHHPGSSYGQLESGGTTPTSLVTADSSQRFPVARHSSLGRRSNQNYRSSGLSSRLSNVDEVGEMQQVHIPQQVSHLPPPLPSDSTRMPPMRSNTHRRRSPPPPPPPPPPSAMLQRHRGNTFSDIPPDDLPPYIDPIEEAMAATSGTSSPASATVPSHEHEESLHDDHRQSPPPYHTLSVPSRAHIRN
ncbi:hypothetical protein COEREDRAFT_10025 [Coemansia reversa NRRL 1564]|uniref:Uncharacterized protein n=1 Tax=Coemansia reversa (strain ATCC 12441 / NRRL 1564) TaxID=763665 RepID=A0A2G5B6X3_COERN|nr:hypothetical protein COEREDRAFT_10025 [Coemansia reversa NRRL 1564]|eukprot:PIA14758.1 hypothetical protein COEREDRAFT_10025 [Coemansia reversa NRRL 1564]